MSVSTLPVVIEYSMSRCVDELQLEIMESIPCLGDVGAGDVAGCRDERSL